MDLGIDSLELFTDLSDRLTWRDVKGDQYGMRCSDVAGMVQLFPEKAKIELHILALEVPC